MIRKSTPFHKSLSGRLMAAIALVALLSVGGLGLAAYLAERTALEAQLEAQLTSVADLKKEQIVAWLEERRADARLLAINKLNQDHFTQILSPQVPESHKKELADFLTDNLIGMQQSRVGYSEISFVDRNGIVIIATDPTVVGRPTAHEVAFSGTLAEPDGAFMQDIHFNPNTGLMGMTFGHVIHAIDLETGAELPATIGAVIIVVNMDETIYPLIRNWPGMGGTGETLLTRAEGETTLFLNNLRFNDDAALNLRLPSRSTEARPAHLAARGSEGIIKTPDYRGVPVLAAYRHIPGIEWGFVAKEDLDEVFAPVNDLAWRIGLGAAGMVIIAGLVSVTLSRTLTRPLAQLVEGARTVAAGNQTAEIEVVRQDEVGQLAQAFNEMAHAVQRRETELQELAASLEQRVEARTADLQTANQQLQQEIKERKRTQAALRHSEERFRQVITSISDHVYMTEFTREGHKINRYLSPNVEALTGYPPEKFKKDWHFWPGTVIHPDDRPAAARQAARLAQGQNSEMEYRLVRANGEIIWVRDSGRVERDPTHQSLIVYGVVSDVTARKRAEEELTLARDQALEASRLKTQLLANVSHDLRTPLNAIMGYTEMLQEGVYGSLSDKQYAATTDIMGSTGQLLDFINKLLDQAQIESGKVVLKQTAFAPLDLIEAIQSTMGVVAGTKGLELTSDVGPDVPDILYGDPYWLRQILANLVSNAIKFTEQGHVHIHLYRFDEDRWALQVSDTGPGISAEARAYIFDTFWQMDDPIKKIPAGSGLGLSIVKQLTTLMNGQILLNTGTGHGSTFTVVLPLLEPVPERVPQ